ncbi:MAG: hypothetical protein ACK5OB_10335 [Pirellula sp.]
MDAYTRRKWHTLERYSDLSNTLTLITHRSRQTMLQRKLSPILGLSIGLCVLLCTQSAQAQNSLGQNSNPVLGNGWPTGAWTSPTQGNSGVKTMWRDASGRVHTTATQQGNRTLFRDRSGRVIGSAVTGGQSTTLRDASGRIVQTIRGSESTRTVRDARGQSLGRITSTAQGTQYRDASGRVTGSSTVARSGTTVRSSSGRVVGSSTSSSSRGSSRR